MKVQENINEKAVTKQSDNGTVINIKGIDSFEQAELLANWIAESSTFNTNFKKEVENKDGKMELVVSKSDIVTCLLLGNELGFSPMMSITLGKKLNREAAVKCTRGKELGLSPTASLENIFVFNAGGREIVYTGIHVVNKVLTDNGVTKEVLEDGTQPFVYYTHFKEKLRGQELEVPYNENVHAIINGTLSATELDQKLANGAIPVIMNFTRRALVKLTRGNESVAIPYTLRQATEAGLYRGTKEDGETVKGKDNWNNHPATHLIKMSIMLGARMIASDKLNGIYNADELTFVKDRPFVNDAEYAEVVDEVIDKD